MILIIAGSRHLRVPQTEIDKAMEFIDMPDVVVCGECEGPDISGKLWAQHNKITVWSLPAPWNAWGKRLGQEEISVWLSLQTKL